MIRRLPEHRAPPASQIGGESGRFDPVLNKRIVIWTALVGLALAGGWLLPRFSGLWYHGRHLTRWLDDLDPFAWLAGNTNAPGQAEPRAAFRAIGPRALPVLQEWFEAREHTGRLRRWLPFARVGHAMDSQTRAVIAIETLGTNAAPLASFLVASLHDPARKANAMLALAGIGPAAAAAVPALIRLLVENDPVTPGDYQYPWAAAATLTAIGTPASPALTGVLARNDMPPAARLRAAWVLGSMRPRAKSAIPALMAVAREAAVPFSLFMAVVNAAGQIGVDDPGQLAELGELFARQTGHPVAERLVNGQFDLGITGTSEQLFPPGATNLAGWSSYAGNIVVRLNRLTPETGRCLELGPRNPPGAVAQTVLTRAGATYVLSFMAAAGENSLLGVSAGNLDTTIRLPRDFNSANNDTNRLAPFTLRFQAASTLSTIVFRAVGLAEFGPMIDAVTLEPAPVDAAARP